MLTRRLPPRTATRLRFIPATLTSQSPTPPARQCLRSVQQSSSRFLTSSRRSSASSPIPMAAETDTLASTTNTSGITPASLKATLETKLGAEYVEIEDMSGTPNPLSIIQVPPGPKSEPLTPTPTPTPTNSLTSSTTTGGCGQAYHAIIVSGQFTNKTALARHRLVNAALKEEIKAIHAWTPKCFTPEQWERERERGREGR